MGGLGLTDGYKWLCADILSVATSTGIVSLTVNMLEGILKMAIVEKSD